MFVTSRYTVRAMRGADKRRSGAAGHGRISKVIIALITKYLDESDIFFTVFHIFPPRYEEAGKR